MSPSESSPDTSDGFQHPRCYARSRADCSRDLSSEHFLSEALLKRIQSAAGGVFVRGFPWQKSEVQRIGIASLASNVLCKHHNELLSPLDSEALRLVELIEQCLSHPPGSSEGTVSGPLVQRYLLKVLCGSIASKAARYRATQILAEIPEAWLRLLFGDQPFPEGCGLKAGAIVGERWDDDPNSYAVAPVLLDGRPIGLDARLRRFRLRLLMVDPGKNPVPAFGGAILSRPTCINMDHPHGRFSLHFVW